jgi:hypothetical protein
MTLRELECVVKQIADRRGQKLRVAKDAYVLSHGADAEAAIPRSGVEGRGGFDVA